MCGFVRGALRAFHSSAILYPPCICTSPLFNELLQFVGSPGLLLAVSLRLLITRLDVVQRMIRIKSGGSGRWKWKSSSTFARISQAIDPELMIRTNLYARYLVLACIIDVACNLQLVINSFNGQLFLYTCPSLSLNIHVNNSWIF